MVLAHALEIYRFPQLLAQIIAVIFWVVIVTDMDAKLFPAFEGASRLRRQVPPQVEPKESEKKHKKAFRFGVNMFV